MHLPSLFSKQVGLEWSSGDKENTRFSDLPKTILELSTAEMNKEVDPEKKDDMSNGRSNLKAKSRKEDREKMSVKWIAIQPEASARTSLRCVADYLSEKESESSLMQLQHQQLKRSLRLSPDCLNALENAEKLVEDAKRQISQFILKPELADDYEPDRSSISSSSRFVDESTTYIRKIVATYLEKGIYEPPTLATDVYIPVSSFGRNLVSALASDEECLLCRGKSTPKLNPISVAIGTAPVNGNKLSVQRGPAISIKADLCIQTSRIVDIQPAMDSPPTSRPCDDENIANFKFYHETFVDSVVAKKEEELRKREANDTMTSITGLEQSSTEASIALDTSSDVDLSLREPGIIAEIEVLLSQQRTIMKEAHLSSQALEQLFQKSALLTDAAKDAASPNDEEEDYSIVESFDLVLSSDSTQPARSSETALKSHERCKSNISFIENPKSSSLQISKPSSQTVHSPDSRDHEDIGEVEVTDSKNKNSNVLTQQNGLADSDDQREIDEKKETENSLVHKTSHFINSLSEDLSLSKLSKLQVAAQSQLDPKTAIDAQLFNRSARSVNNDSESVSDATAQQIISEKLLSDLGHTAANESSDISDNRRVILLLEPPSFEQQKLSLLKKLESCSISTGYPCRRQPITSTVLGDFALLQSELSSEATHSEGELCFSSSASYSLGEVHHKINVDPSTSYGSSTSQASQLKTAMLQYSIGEYFKLSK